MITILGKEYKADRLSTESALILRNYIERLARETWNPYPALAIKISSLPEHLQVAAMQELVRDKSGPDHDHYITCLLSVPAIRLAVYLITGEDVDINEENKMGVWNVIKLILGPEKVIQGKDAIAKFIEEKKHA